MNREQKAVAIEEIVTQIDESQAIFAVDYRGISVPQVAELRAKLRDADATFKVVKNSLTERAADQAGAETLKQYLAGPTALTFVRGDAATAAKAIADYAKATQLLPFKGGLMDGDTLDVEQIRSLSRLPSREVLYGQLVGVVASPVSGLVRTLNALVSGLAVALGQVNQKKESGEIPAAAPPAAAAPAAEPAAQESAVADRQTAEPDAEQPAAAASATSDADASQEQDAAGSAPEPTAETASDEKAEPASEPAQDDDKQADASAEAEQDPADAQSTKED
ncbi:MAG TPA: 50S ribosomal protein L10 [Solirubrobacteraceae bacterium]|nr:50S ribosomal protein L10 [Solirubrobacteraceae bacterium]